MENKGFEADGCSLEVHVDAEHSSEMHSGKITPELNEPEDTATAENGEKSSDVTQEIVEHQPDPPKFIRVLAEWPMSCFGKNK